MVLYSDWWWSEDGGFVVVPVVFGCGKSFKLLRVTVSKSNSVVPSDPL